jgi:ceramide glucosyltransferase
MGLLAGLLAGLCALAGAAVAVLAARAFHRFGRSVPPAGPALPATVLKPLHGAEPGLRENLLATLRQDHAAPFQVLFAVADATDAAAPVAEAAMAAAPATDAALLRDGRLHGPNRKVSQLVNLMDHARHPVLVVADADMRVPPHWLTAVTAPLADPAVGLVTCLYQAEAADGGGWSRLAALGIDWHFLPHACFGEAIGRAQGCYGATMALRAETLARIGGFAALAGLLADDHALGAAVRRLGLRVVVAPVLPVHRMAEPGLAALLRHELRWARTLRLLDPAGHAGMGITYPVVPGALAAALAPAPWGWLALGIALAARLGLALVVERVLRRPWRWGRLALLPVREVVSAGIWLAALFPGTVLWQGRRYRMRWDGSMVEAGLPA